MVPSTGSVDLPHPRPVITISDTAWLAWCVGWVGLGWGGVGWGGVGEVGFWVGWGVSDYDLIHRLAGLVIKMG
jgi:hypothetical protein